MLGEEEMRFGFRVWGVEFRVDGSSSTLSFIVFELLPPGNCWHCSIVRPYKAFSINSRTYLGHKVSPKDTLT